MRKINKRNFTVHKNLALFLGLFLLLGTLLIVIIQKFSPLIGHATYYCQSFIAAHTIAIPYYLSLIPVALILLILMISILKFFILIIRVRYLKNSLSNKTIVKSDLGSLIIKLKLNEKTIVIKTNQKFAFCLGVRKPKIYISSGLISKLTIKEIEAVLRHEQYHLENHDTFTMMLASFGYSLFPLFPIVGDLIKSYKIEREISADKFAVEKVGSSYPLVSALKKLLIYPAIEEIAVASIADQDTLEPRICSLINKDYKKRQFLIRHLFMTILSVVIFGTIMIVPVHAREIHHMKHDVIMLCADGSSCMNSCANDQNMNKLYSSMSSSKASVSSSSQSYSSIK